MKFKEITVSGIVNVVINRKAHWKCVGASGDNEPVLWERQIPEGKVLGEGAYVLFTDEQMMGVVNRLKVDRRFRMWVHGDTLNIVRK